MLESIIQIISRGAEAGAAASHSPQTAMAAVLCAVLVSLVN